MSAQGHAALAAVLGEIATEIEHLGVALCSDAAFVARHATALQAIDPIAQTQRAVAEMLGATCLACAADAVPLEALRARMVAATAACEGECRPGQMPNAPVTPL